MTLIKLKSRFKTLTGLNSILSAMQVAAVVRMQRAKERYARVEGYANLLKSALNGRFKPESRKKKALLVITSVRGLCGDYNKSLTVKVEEYLSDKIGFDVIYPEKDMMDKLDFEKAAGILAGIFDPDRELYIAHNRYQSSIKLIPSIYRLYPSPEEILTGFPLDLTLEPTSQEFLAGALRSYLEVRFYQLLLNSLMGEMTSRLLILNGAVENSKDLIGGLRIAINKARQAGITRELAEVTASAETIRSEENE